MSIDELESTTSNAIVARRNLLLGHWAGLRIGYRSDRLANYVEEVMAADFLVAGPGDVVGKIVADFEDAGVDFQSAAVIDQMVSIERAVRSELLGTD